MLNQPTSDANDPGACGAVDVPKTHTDNPSRTRKPLFTSPLTYPPMSDHNLRAAEPTDVEAIQQVAEASWHAAHDHIIGVDAVDEFLAEHYDRESVTAGILDDDSAYYVAELAGNVVGFAVGVPHDDATWSLGAIYVHPDYWGGGIGTALLDAVESAARAAGGEHLRLVVMAENVRARRFYEACGYETNSVESDGPLDVQEATYTRALRDQR